VALGDYERNDADTGLAHLLETIETVEQAFKRDGLPTL
jgi:hypothetical protein